MSTYTAYLRAINVSGHNIIKMEDLRRMIAAPGISNVATYIQSGNVVFDAKEADTDALARKLEKHLEKQLGYFVEIFVRSTPDLETIVQVNPFKDRSNTGAMQYVSFLSGEPDKEQVAALLAFNNDTDTFAVIGMELYAYVVKDGSRSRFEPKLVEKKLGVLATTRNINTVNKMLQLSLSR